MSAGREDIPHKNDEKNVSDSETLRSSLESSFSLTDSDEMSNEENDFIAPDTLIGAFFSSPEIIDRIGDFLPPQGRSACSSLSKASHVLFAYPLEKHAKMRLIELTAMGDEGKAQKIMARYPSFKADKKLMENVRVTKFLRLNALRQVAEVEEMIQECPSLLQLKGLVIDPRTGLVLENISALQYDIFMLDTAMVRMKLGYMNIYLSEEIAAEQFKEHFAKAEGLFFDFRKIKRAYRSFDDSYRNYLLVNDVLSQELATATLQFLIEKIGIGQSALPLHIWYEFLRADIPLIRDGEPRDFSEDLPQRPFVDVHLVGDNAGCAIIRADRQAFMLLNPIDNQNFVAFAEQIRLDLLALERIERNRIKSLVELHKQLNPTLKKAHK